MRFHHKPVCNIPRRGGGDGEGEERKGGREGKKMRATENKDKMIPRFL